MTAVPTDTSASRSTEPSEPNAGWREPTSGLSLRWGSYRLRHRLGVTLLVGAALATFWRIWVDGWGTYLLSVPRAWATPVLMFVFVCLLVIAGVFAMPARSARRWVALGLLLLVLLGLGFVESFVASLFDIFGLGSLAVGLLGTLAWLVLRERSAPAYAVGLPVALVATVTLAWVRLNSPLPDLRHQGWLYLAVPLLAVCGAAWLARALEPRLGARRALAGTTAQAQRSQTTAASEAEAIAAQVRTMAALQEAWEKEHPGQPMPAIAVAPTAAPSATGNNNVLAILSLVFGLMGGGLVAVVLGHMARAQIRRTGERGDGMAIAGLVLGYLGLAILVAYLVVVVGVLASLS